MRNVKIYTGVGGYELLMEAMENQLGYSRVYIGKKVLRILRRLKTPIKKSPTGRYYKLMKNG